MKKTLLATLAILLSTISAAFAATDSYTLTSPDNQTSVQIHANPLAIGVAHGNNVLLKESPIALKLTDGTAIDKVTKTGKSHTNSEAIEAPFYRQKSLSMTYNERIFKLNGDFSLVVRAYDQGIAYRFVSNRKKAFTIADETAEYNFEGDPKAWIPYSNSGNADNPFACSFENLYNEIRLSQAEKAAFLPLTVDCGKAKLTLLESDLEAYPGMMVNAQGGKDGSSLKAIFPCYPKAFKQTPARQQRRVTETEEFIAKVDGKRSFPWRLFAVTTDDAQMPVNDLVYATASPNRIGDTSWIKPGKVAWDWWNNWNIKGVDFKSGINMKTYKYYIDFAAKNGIEYIVLDEGWYVPQSGDVLTVIPELNLPELVAYGKSKGVDVVLWMVFNSLDDVLEEACTKYSEMGVAGFKIDFLDRHDQEAVEMAYRISEAAARHHLFVDYHGFWKPTGLSRTYPNVLNYEGVYGLENSKWMNEKVDHPRYNVTIPFIRMMAGPMDYTPGAMRNRSKSDWHPSHSMPCSMGTRCHQLAMYVVYDSPFEMLCDAPTMYEAEPEFTSFLASIPTIFDETVIPCGKINEYIVTARHAGDSWYVGGMTNWEARDITIDASKFLPAGKYTVEVYMDGPNAAKNAEDYMHQTMDINYDGTMKATVHLAPGGGFTAKITKK